MDLTATRKLARRSFKGLGRKSIYLVPASLIFFLFIWEAISRYAQLPVFILPGPGVVWERFRIAFVDGSLVSHTLVTLTEVLSGLLVGTLAGAILGYVLAKSPTIERWLSPYIVASQAIPIVAIAPLLVIWLRPGLLSKVLISALIVFFPILINTIIGLRSVPEDLRDLLRSLHASRWQTFRMLEVPASLPVLLGGIRVGATLSVIGAVVGEFVASDRGLGFLINVGRGQYDTALVFVAVFTLVSMALVLYGAVAFLENQLLTWQQRPDE
jgi:NitT/TauT family transport system permease protein